MACRPPEAYLCPVLLLALWFPGSGGGCLGHVSSVSVYHWSGHTVEFIQNLKELQ